VKSGIFGKKLRSGWEIFLTKLNKEFEMNSLTFLAIAAFVGMYFARQHTLKNRDD
jgi:hypothetical protein